VKPKSNLLVAAAASIALALTFGAYTPQAHASCAAPTVDVAGKGPFEMGDSVVIRGRYWTGECNDVIACSVGCFGQETCTGGGPPAPAQDITLVLQGHGVSVPLADGISGLSFEVQVSIPGVLPGVYRVVGDSPDSGPWRSDPIRIDGH
jgi:hypothetical protein